MSNEKIEDIVRDVRHVSELHGMSYKDDKNWPMTIHNYTRILAERIDAAHKREIIVERNLGTDEIDMAVASKDATIARLTEALKSIVSYGENKSSMDDPYNADYWIVRNIASAALAVEGGAK